MEPFLEKCFYRHHQLSSNFSILRRYLIRYLYLTSLYSPKKLWSTSLSQNMEKGVTKQTIYVWLNFDNFQTILAKTIDYTLIYLPPLTFPTINSYRMTRLAPKTMLSLCQMRWTCYGTPFNIDRWGKVGGLFILFRCSYNSCKCRQCFDQDWSSTQPN